MVQAVLHFHLQKHSSPITTDIANNLHVDNVITGCATESGAVKYYTEARSILSKAKFNLQPWASNRDQVTKLAANDGVCDSNPMIKVLGLLWHTSSDTISLASQITVEHITFTKREILQNYSAIFNPLGFITPVTIKAKILLQQLWKLLVDWDESLNSDLQETWCKITQDIKEATEVMPRQYFPTSTFLPQELHVFADASPKAYGTVAYFVQGEHTSVIMSKTKVSPLKNISLPRLQLQAAVLATRLTTFILVALKWQGTTHLWSDSQIVLCWINNSKKMTPFVSHRGVEITNSFAANKWHYCPSTDISADLPTRGITFHN